MPRQRRHPDDGSELGPDGRAERLRTTLEADRWEDASSDLLAKVLEEFTYEGLFEPSVRERSGECSEYVLDLDDVTYRFDGRERVFDSLRVDPESVERRPDGDAWEDAVDPIRLLLDARDELAVDDQTCSHLVREYSNTLLADAHIRARNERDDVESVLDEPYARIEGHMEGHPWFTVNKGRIGFGYDDYLRYAPEQRSRQSLQWIAVRRDEAAFASVEGVSYDSLVDRVLGARRPELEAVLEERGLDPASYYLLPVHEWQWDDTVAQLFAAQIAADDVVPLGAGASSYLPQQSIRTLTDCDDPTQPYVKLPLCVLNTIVYRGLPGEQALAAPRVTEFVKRLRDEDPFLRDECELVLPGEIAGLRYDHPAFSELSEAPYQFHELLGAVWRESVQSLAADGERALPLSALLHRDVDGTPIVTKLAARAGTSIESWLEAFFDAFFPPLLHVLYRYGVVFMPHGTNVVLLLEDGEPARIAVKDFVDEIAVSADRLPEAAFVPDDLYEHDDLLQQKEPEALCQHVFGTVFICVLRYVSDLLERAEGYDERRFWRQVRGSIERYQEEWPELQDRFERFDLLKPQFTRLCLNRGRLTDDAYRDSPEPPAVTAHGTVTNTLADLDPL